MVEPLPSIVCGVDRSPGAHAAARFAGDLASRLALRVVLVYVVPPPIPQSELGMAARTTDAAVIEDLRKAGVKLLDEVARELELDHDREAIGQIKFGGASEALSAVAESERAESVVVGSRGLGSVGTLLLGSVSLRLAVHGPCPTVIVPESAGTVGDSPIMCAVDDSEEARAGVSIAATLSERLKTKLLLVHAAPDDAPSGVGNELLARLVVESGLGTQVERLVIRGDPAQAIVDAAATHRVGMLVIGSRGRGALASAALGSVSSAVARRSPCAVTIVRARYADSAES